MKYLRYLKQILVHKWFVFLACCRLGIPWRGIVHDWSKFLPDEFIPYARFFFGYERGKQPPEVKAAFQIAWNLHQKRNKHHWQHWAHFAYGDTQDYSVMEHNPGSGLILGYKSKPFLMECEIEPPTQNEHFKQLHWMAEILNNAPKPLPFPEVYARELVADWIGAGQAYGQPDTMKWYGENRWRTLLHLDTREYVEDLLFKLCD